MSDRKKLLIFLPAAIVIGLIWMFMPDKEVESEKRYFAGLNLSLTGTVKTVIPANGKGYGAIYLENVSSNKGIAYETSYNTDFLFCKISDGKAIIITSVSQVWPADSISINTAKAKYFLYRKKRPVDSTTIGPWLYNDKDFYNYMQNMGYLNLAYYSKPHPFGSKQ